MRDESSHARTRLTSELLEDRTVPTGLTPVYDVTFDDAVTADNAFARSGGGRGWTIDGGADVYQTDVYERPTAQTFQVVRGADGVQRFAAAEYYQNLDIVRASAGFDANHLYVSIKLAGLSKLTQDGGASAEGLKYRYGFRLSTAADGGGGLLVTAEQPGEKNPTFGGQAVYAHRDANGDVGGTGLSVTKQDRPAEVNGNGYERVVAADGRGMVGQQVVWARVSPADPTVVEFALDYKAFGYTADQLESLAYLQFEANKGLQDPANYLWNDEYTQSEAGSPYRATNGDLSRSVLGTQGLGNIYELDTLTGGAITRGGTASVSGSVFVDTDLSGDRGAFDFGIAGVTVILTGTDDRGQAVSQTTTTDAEGNYQFAALRAGTYTLTEVQPTGFDDGADLIGSNGGFLDGNDRIAGITLADGDAATGYEFIERNENPS